MVIIEVTRIGRAEKPQSLKDGDSALPCYYGNWNAPVPFMGRTLAMYTPGANSPLYFDHPNALGSEGQWTTASGTYGGELQFYPWGQEGPNTTNGTLYQYFASLEWTDTQTDGYQTPNRYFIPRHGRWLTPDPSGIKAVRLDDPQTWNMYAYVRNNPTTVTDPTGLDGNDPPAGPQQTTYEAYPGPYAKEDTVQPPDSGVSAGAALGVSLTADSIPTTGAGLGAIVDSLPLALGLGAGVGAVIGAADLLITDVTNTLVENYKGSEQLAATESVVEVQNIKILSLSGPKAADAPGVTAGGQATDAHGNKLGPSGETQIDRTRSNTRESARNRALDEGSGAVEHSNPKVGRGHWHPTDSEGNKKPSSAHHEYPNE